MTKIDLITGILGSGKTTFMLRYARHLIDSGEKIAILENDFGAVNIDMMILQELKCDRCQLEMVAGGGDADCHRRRFKTQLISLGMQGFDRVIVEPSGIFDMDEFFDILHESPLDRWFETGSVLTIIDAETEDDLSPQMEYLLASEAACSGRLILSKLHPGDDAEMIAERQLSHINRALEEIKCNRRFRRSDMTAQLWDDFTAEDFGAFMRAGYRGSAYIKKFSPDEIRSSVHYFMHINMPESSIESVINSIINEPGCGRIYRIKGALPDVNGGWIKINATREKTEIGRAVNGQSVLIVIGDGIDRDRIDEVFKAVNTDPEYVSI